MSDDDDTSHFNNDPTIDDETTVDQQQRAPAAPPKRKRARSSGSRTSFDPTSDPICIAILAFLNQSPAPTITHRARFQLNGEDVSVGGMMYTLRRQSCKPDHTMIVAGRLKHLATNDAWLKFMDGARDTSAHASIVVPTTTLTTTNPTAVQVGVGLEGDIDKLAHCCLVKEYQMYSSLLAISEFYLLLWQSVPAIRPTLKENLHKKIQRYKKRCLF